MLRFITLPLAAITLSACESREETDGSEIGGPVEESGVSAEAVSLYRAYIAEKGQDPEACFEGLPEIRQERVTAQFVEGAASPTVDRVMVAIDASGSMAGRFGGQTKMAAAKSAASGFMADLPSEVQAGLLVFGHEGDNSDAGKARSCGAVETIYRIGDADKGRIAAALGRFEATGWTPLAAAIEQAGSSFTASDLPGEQVVYVVSDGEETCGGDPVAAARALNGGKTRAVVNIIGFDLAARDRAQLRAVSEAGGGEFLEVRSASELSRALKDSVRRNRNTAAMGGAELRANTQAAGNTLRTLTAKSRLSVCLNRAHSVVKRDLSAWARERGLERETVREIDALIDARKAELDERKDAFDAQADAARNSANAVLETDRTTVRKTFDAIEGTDGRP